MCIQLVKKHFQEDAQRKIIYNSVPITDVRKIDKADFLQFTGLQIINTPGHTVYYHPKDRVLIYRKKCYFQASDEAICSGYSKSFTVG